MRKWVVAVAMLLAGMAAQAGDMDISKCKFPASPDVPDGATATEEEMGQAGAKVREYVAGIQTSLQCLSEVEKSMGEEITKEQQAQLVTAYNSGVDHMNALAGKYNEQVRAFKAR